MTTNKHTRYLSHVAAFVLLVGAGVAHATQQSDQIAVQLGAIQLGYSGSVSALTSQQQANALKQGQLAQATTVANYNANVSAKKYVTGATCPNPQTLTYQSQLYTATIKALQSPVTNLTGITGLTVVLANNTSSKVTAVLDPTKTTPDLVAKVSTALVPNYGSAFASNAVAASLAYTTNANGIFFPVYGPQPSSADVNKYATNSYGLNKKTAAAQLVTAGKAASVAMTAALKVYATGTINWAAYPKTGVPTNSAYLPNYGTTTVNSGTNAYTPNQTGLADAAATVAASAINGLGAVNTNSANLNSGLYGITASNATSISQALTKAALAYQATATKAIPSETHYAVGALGADAFGLVTQVAGPTNSVWGGQATGGLTYILNGLVSGMVKAVGATSTANVTALITGVSQGFYADYLATCYNTQTTPITQSAFLGNNLSGITTAFTSAGVKNISSPTFQTTISAAFGGVYNAAYNGANGVTLIEPKYWNVTSYPIAGYYGVNKMGYINGTGSPVTDTVGM